MKVIIKSFSEISTTTLVVEDFPPDESDSLYFDMNSEDRDGKRIEGADMIISRNDLRYLKAIIEAFLNTPIIPE
jgi:uncharacterized protein involved in tellurium resistance